MIFLLSWLPVALWALVIFTFSSIPSLDTGWGWWDTILRKLAHIFEFGLLAFLSFRAMARTWPGFQIRSIIVGGSIFSFLYAVSDEIHQAFVPGRGPSAGDVLIDLCGVAICGTFYYRWRATGRGA